MNVKSKGILQEYEPKVVLQYFEEICNIPHGSRNTERLSKEIVSLAEEQGLKNTRDHRGNIIVWKPATAGYEDQATIILQGHMDMVAVKTNNCPLDLAVDPLDVQVDGDNIYAKGTSLGGDDGIAVAYMLAVMTDDSIQHPPLELVFTTDEEIGLAGISEMDVSALQGRKLMNLDTEEEGVMIAGCAGGVKTVCHIPTEETWGQGKCFKITVNGLQGGHSGTEIHKERGNANLILARVLYQLNKSCGIQLMEMEGGEKDNAIPYQAQAVVASTAKPEELQEQLAELEMELKGELFGKDDGIILNLTLVEDCDQEQSGARSGAEGFKVLTDESFHKVCMCLLMNPNGVQAMSSTIAGTVETSLNCGIMKLDKDGFLARYALRSSVKSSKNYLKERITEYIRLLGGTVSYEGDYPPWEYRADSPFRDQVMNIYENMYQKPMDVQVIHAGLECGYLSEQLAGLDCVSIGPDMKNIHTTDETLSIASVGRVWEFLLAVLRER